MSPVLKEIMVITGVMLSALLLVGVGVLVLTVVFVLLSFISQFLAAIFSILIVIVVFAAFLVGLMRMLDGDDNE